MKKYIAAVLIFLFFSCFLTACGKKPSSSVLEFSIPQEYEEAALDFCVSQDGTIYVAARDSILTYTPEGQAGDVLELPGRYLSRVASGEGTLYAYDELGREILELGQDGTVLGQIPVWLISNGVLRMLVSGDRIWLMYENEVHDNALLSVSLSGGIQEPVPIPDLYDIGPYDRDHLLIRRSSVYFLLDQETGETAQYYRANHLGGGYVFDPREKNLYYISDNTLYRREEQSQEQTIVRLLDHSYERVELWEDTLVMFDREENSICSLNPGAAFEETGDLTTYDFERYSIPYASDYTEKTGVKVVDIMGSTTDESFLKQLLSGEDRFDIFVVYSSGINSAKFWENHAYTDLSASETLVEAVDGMHESLRASAYQGEELMGIPLWAYGVGMAYNTEVEEASRGLEEIKDWDSFFRFLEENSPGCTVLGNKAGMYGFLFDQYFYGYYGPEGEGADFDTDAFRKVLDLMKQIHDSPYLQEPGMGSMSYVGDNSFRPTDILGINNGLEPAGSALLHRLPDIEGTRSLSSQIGAAYAVVNPNSERKEEAIRYLEALVAGEEFLSVPSVFPLPEYEEWNRYMEDAVVCYEMGIYERVSPYINDWVTGRISKEEAIASIQERVKLILAE